jgi:ABC-type Fe3+-siderophore transport system permease subunit
LVAICFTERIAGYSVFKNIHNQSILGREDGNTVVFIRLPRILMACLVGCCLSAAGAAYQGVFQKSHGGS